mgnify:FL=1
MEKSTKNFLEIKILNKLIKVKDNLIKLLLLAMISIVLIGMLPSKASVIILTLNYLILLSAKMILTQKINDLKEDEEKETDGIDIYKIVANFVKQKEITREMLVSLVDKIELSEDKEITIYYKFNALNMNMVKNDNKENRK